MMEFSKAKNVEGKLAWVDWMKSIGFYFIVLGHFFSIGDKYVYVFNVPLFFVISGFLCKRESSSSVFWKKLWYNLIVPMVIIITLNFVISCIIDIFHNTFQFSDLFLFFPEAIIGMGCVLHECWFIYTLILAKVIYHFLYGWKAHFALIVFFLFVAYLYNQYDIYGYALYKYPNSIANVLTAYPFFAIGIFFRRYRFFLNEWNSKSGLFVLFIIGLGLIYVCGNNNDYVWMFACGYGGNFLYFLVGGISGVCAVFSLSKLLNSYPTVIKHISVGAIIILGFHMYFIDFIREYLLERSMLDYVFAVLIMAVFIPIIIILEKKFPIILGKFRVVRYSQN